MAVEIKLPKRGQTMEDGAIVNFSVKAGDQVKQGDVVFEIETDKATVEIESGGDGFVKLILAEAGQTIVVGETILVLGDENEIIDESLAKPAKTVEADNEAMAQTKVSPDEVAKYFSLSVKTIYRWIDEGRLDAIKIGDKTLRIPYKAIKTLEKDISA